MTAAGRRVVQVKTGHRQNLDSEDGLYYLDSSKEAYEELFTRLQSEYRFTHIIHMGTTGQELIPESAEELENTQQLGARSLMYLTQALAYVGYERGLSLTLISEHVNEVTGNERIVQPHQAPLWAWAK